MSVNFTTTPERYQVSSWKLLKEKEIITDAKILLAGDKVKFNVAFLNLMIDKECVLFIRAFSNNKLVGMKAQEVTIFPDVLPFDLTTDEFVVPEGTDRIELALFKTFESVTKDEEDLFLIGKNIHGLTPVEFDTFTDGFEPVIEEASEKPSLYLGDYELGKKLFSGTVCFVQESASLWIKDAKYSAEKITIRKDEKLWIPIETANSLFGKEFTGEDGYIELYALAKELGAYAYTNRFGLGVISDLPYDYAETKYNKPAQLMVRYIEFDRPKAAQLKKMFKERIRPRTLICEEDILRVLKVTETNERAKWYSEKVIEIADEFMKLPIQYKLDRGYVGASRITAIIDYEEILGLYWAYRKTGERKYVEHIKKVVLAMCGFEHWCGEFFSLMTSRALVTVGLAYDLLYDEFTHEEREFMAKAIVEKGFMPTLELYYGRGKREDWPWVIRRTNWNFIPNSGMIFAACVIFDEYETDICADVLEKALKSLEIPSIYLAPDGELFEGIGYAAYSLNYLSMFCINALEATFGTSFHFGDCAGLKESYKIPFKLLTTTGFLTAGDAGASMMLDTKYNSWWAKRFDDHNIQSMRHLQLVHPKGSQVKFSDLFWFDEDAYEVAQFECDSFFGNTQNAVSRSDWGPDARVLFVHGGRNTDEHGHLDLGTFELEVGGYRFAAETGPDKVTYCAPGSKYLDGKHDDYYIARAEAHNVYIINPDRGPGQRSLGNAQTVPVELTDDRALYMMDLESAYRGQVKAAKRYFELKNNRQVFVVQDEITPMNPGDEFYWHWHTFAEITFPKDPIAVAIDDDRVKLTAPDGRVLNLKVDANVKFELRKGMGLPMEKSPKPFDQLQGGMISNLLSIYFKSGDEPIIFRVTAWEEGSEYIPEDLKSYEI